jgi:hypothetical protein
VSSEVRLCAGVFLHFTLLHYSTVRIL